MRAKIFALWAEVGHRLFGFGHIGLYSPDDEIVAVTFSNSAEYLDKVEEVALDEDQRRHQ